MEVVVDGIQYAPVKTVQVHNFPKLESPFVRTGVKHGIIDEIAEDMEWVFEDDEVICSEKINGTNVSIVIQGGQLIGIYNRKNKIEIGILETNRFLEGTRNARAKGWIKLDQDGQFFGELMGPGIQGNFLKLQQCLWFPFRYMREKCKWRSWGKYPKTFDVISEWFKEDLFSLIYMHYFAVEKVMSEGVVFYQPSTGRMAKLRRDMFSWYKK